MTEAYLRELVDHYPAIREVWLYGSRANGTARPDSDWDYLAFADDITLAALARDTRFHVENVDLMIIFDGDKFAKPWKDGEQEKTGSLRSEFIHGGLEWCPKSESEASYRATKPITDSDGEFNVQVRQQRAFRIYIRTDV